MDGGLSLRRMLEEHLRALRDAHQEKNERALERLKSQSDAMDAKVKELDAEVASTEDERRQADAAETAAHSDYREKKEESLDADRRLKTLEQMTESPLAAFGDFQAKLADAVQRHARKFDARPVGPVGERRGSRVTCTST